MILMPSALRASNESINGDPDSSHEKTGKHGLLGRLRALLGLGGGSLREDVQEAIEDITEASGFSALEREMLANVLSLHEVHVADIMIPRADIIAVAIDASLAEVLESFGRPGIRVCRFTPKISTIRAA